MELWPRLLQVHPHKYCHCQRQLCDSSWDNTPQIQHSLWICQEGNYLLWDYNAMRMPITSAMLCFSQPEVRACAEERQAKTGIHEDAFRGEMFVSVKYTFLFTSWNFGLHEPTKLLLDQGWTEFLSLVTPSSSNLLMQLLQKFSLKVTTNKTETGNYRNVGEIP